MRVISMIGNILKTMRRKNKLSQQNISNNTGFARNTISQYENEVIQPTFETIEKIANACGYEIIFINSNTKDKLTTTNINREEI